MAIKFTGIDSQWIDFGVTPAQNLVQKTIVLRFKLDTLVTLGDLLGKTNLSGTDVGWFTTVGSDGRFYFINIFGSGVFGGWRTNTGIISAGVEHCVIVRYDNSSASNDPLFDVDGSSVTVNEYLTPSGSTSSDATANLRIGDAESSANGGTNTAVDGIVLTSLVYNRILSASEIADAYASRLAIPSFQGLVFAPNLCGSAEGKIGGDELKATGDVSLLHMDGADGSTTFTDASGKVWTANGNAQIDTEQSMFGGASGLLDADDSISTPGSSTDWDFGTGDFSIDFWLRFSSINGAGANNIIYVHNGAAFDLRVALVTGNILRVTLAGVNKDFAWSPTTATWYHVAVSRNGTSLRAFILGVQIGSTLTSSENIQVTATSFLIGASAESLNGWIDEVRISKGIARWTANFTPPSSAYTLQPYGVPYITDVISGARGTPTGSPILREDTYLTGLPQFPSPTSAGG